MSKKIISLKGSLWLVAILVLPINARAFAQSNKTPAKLSTAATPATPARDGAAKPQPSPAISTGQAIYLVRSTLMMLNDANHSGNYTVMRDLAAPDFQNRNSAADLSQIFSDLRRRKFDLFSVSFASPTFNPDPAIDANGRVRLTGFFPTRPLQIKFDLTFQSVDGHWKLFAIYVETAEAPKQQSFVPQDDSPPPPRGKPFYNVHLFRGTAGWRW